MRSVSSGFRAFATITLATGLSVVLLVLLDRPPKLASRSASPFSAETATATLAPYPLPGTPQAPAKAQATSTATRNPYPLPATPTATRPGGQPPTATATPIKQPTATPTVGSSIVLTTGGPYSIYLPLVMRQVSPYACAPNTDGRGVARYWTYQSFALSDRLTLLVNLCNGNLVVQYTEFAIPGRGLPLAFAHTYNSGSAQWTHSLGTNLTFDMGGEAYLRDADGSTLTFLPSANGNYTSPVGTYDRLVQNGDGTFTVTRTDQTVLAFDVGGVLTQTRDRRGNAINLTYSGGLLSQAQAAGGQALSFNYTDGSLTAVADGAGHTVQLGYSGAALTGFTDPLSATTAFGYSDNLLTSIGDPRGVQTTLGYDANNRLQSIAVAGTPLAAFAYLTATTVYTDGNGNPTTYALNASGQVTRVLDALGGVTTFAYDANYNAVQTTDALGRTGRAGYDANGNVITRTDALTQLTTYAYNASNDLTSVSDPLGRVTTYAYDASGNLTVITDALGVTTTFGYDAYGQRTRATDGNGNNTFFAYSSAGYLITTTDALSNRVVAAYDAVGNRTSVTDARGNATTYTYDAANRLVAATAPLTVGVTATTRYAYDPVGNRTVITDARTNPTRTEYDALNRTVAVTDALTHRTLYAYDGAGNLLSRTDANGNTTRYGYDRVNRTTVITSPLVTITTQFEYDPVGNRTVITDARGNATTYTYDPLNRLTAVSAPLTGTQVAVTRYGYDPVGNRTVVTDANTHATLYGYDRLNRTVAITDANVHTTTFGYDRAGNRIAVTDTAGFTTTYGYDPLHRLTSTTNPAGKSQSVTYDAVGNRLTSVDELGRVTRYVYDHANRLVALTDPLTQTTAYAYDTVGNLTQLTGPKNQGITVTFALTYSYDAVNRLTGKQALLGTSGYAYDNAGNLLTLTDPSGAYSAFAYDPLNRLTQQEDHAVGGSLTVSTTLEYDRNGNRTNATEYYATFSRSTDYSYDKANRLVSTSAPGGVTGYTYDPVGNRTGTTDPLGVTTVVTPNALNLPAQTTHWQGGALLDATTTTYDTRNNPLLRTTLSGTLALTTAYAFNANGYMDVITNANRVTGSGNAYTYSMDYTGNNLVQSIDPAYTSTLPGGLYEIHYDAADRVRCTKQGTDQGLLAWHYYPDGNRQYAYGHFFSTKACPAAGDPVAGGLDGSPIREVYTYDGPRLTLREWQEYGYWSGGATLERSTYGYNGAGQLTQEVHVAGLTSTPVTTTKTYGWSWQGAAQRLTAFTAANGVSTTVDYDYAGRVMRRSTALGYSEYFYEDGTDWLVRETWHVTTTGPVYDLARYYYGDGRLARVEYLKNNDPAQGYAAAQVQYNWHGDAVIAVAAGGNNYGGNGPTNFDPWGNAGYVWSPSLWNNYSWNAAWGYLYFNDLNLYYVHGRWYSPELGRFIEPDEKGEYLYGSGDDAVNYAWSGSGYADEPESFVGICAEVLDEIQAGLDPTDLDPATWLICADLELQHRGYEPSLRERLLQGNALIVFGLVLYRTDLAALAEANADWFMKQQGYTEANAVVRAYNNYKRSSLNTPGPDRIYVKQSGSKVEEVAAVEAKFRQGNITPSSYYQRVVPPFTRSNTNPDINAMITYLRRSGSSAGKAVGEWLFEQQSKNVPIRTYGIGLTLTGRQGFSPEAAELHSGTITVNVKQRLIQVTGRFASSLGKLARQPGTPVDFWKWFRRNARGQGGD